MAAFSIGEAEQYARKVFIIRYTRFEFEPVRLTFFDQVRNSFSST